MSEKFTKDYINKVITCLHFGCEPEALNDIRDTMVFMKERNQKLEQELAEANREKQILQDSYDKLVSKTSHGSYIND